MMTCSRCRKEFDYGAKFCPHCGQEQIFKPFPQTNQNANKNLIKKIAPIILVVGIVVFAIIIQSSHWVETTFGERHEISGIATAFVQEGNGIEANTYLVLASIDGKEEKYVVVRALVPLDYFIVATCVNAGTVELVSATSSSDYPYYIQVSD